MLYGYHTGIGIALAGYFIGDGLKTLTHLILMNARTTFSLKKKIYTSILVLFRSYQGRSETNRARHLRHSAYHEKRKAVCTENCIKRMADFHAGKRITAAMKSGKSFSLPVY
ncbi:hypothetical protein AAV30_10005 [Bacillus velezensis]|nr:hypothetical protein AAV30_10005 [Bacillus velezensis]